MILTKVLQCRLKSKGEVPLSQELLENQLNQSPAPELAITLLTSNFDATHQPPFETSDILTQALSDSFALDGPPSFDESC